MLALACFCTSVMAQQKEAPSLALLEYLAELEKVEDGWVGPLDMLEETADANRQPDAEALLESGEHTQPSAQALKKPSAETSKEEEQ